MQGRLRDIAPPGLKLIETLRWEPGRGAVRLARHLARLSRSCADLGVPCPDAAPLIAGVQGEEPLRLRVTVDLAGQADLATTPLGPAPVTWRAGLAHLRLDSTMPWLRLKTTQRAAHDQVRATLPEGVDEMIFLNECNDVCEGTITNIFVPRDGILLTPPVTSGCLPGVLREELLAQGRAREARLSMGDLREGFLFGNSLRGLIRAEWALDDMLG